MKARTVRPPLFVFEGFDLVICQSIEELYREIEPWDVSDRVEVFDSSGARLLVHTEGVSRTRFTVGGGEVVVDGIDAGQGSAARFRWSLEQYVQAVGVGRLGLDGSDVEALPLGTLVEAVVRFQGRS